MAQARNMTYLMQPLTVHECSSYGYRLICLLELFQPHQDVTTHGNHIHLYAACCAKVSFLWLACRQTRQPANCYVEMLRST